MQENLHPLSGGCRSMFVSSKGVELPGWYSFLCWEITGVPDVFWFLKENDSM